MSSYEVEQPILNSPFREPEEYWFIREGEPPERRKGRRAGIVFPPRDQKAPWTPDPCILNPSPEYTGAFELVLVNLIRERVKAWREAGYPGVSRSTLELLEYWRRDGRGEGQRLFFAQIEAAETIIFLKEARPDFLQGISIPREEPSDDVKEKGYMGFLRYACKMATGAGKTTVMGMLAAWSILNKVNDRSNAMFSDVVLIVCPNVTIRDRLRELNPELGEASLYRTRDLVPPHLMPLLTQGKVLVTNWHVFEPQTIQQGGVGAKVIKAGVRVTVREWIHIGPKTTTARGKRYVSLKDYERQLAAGILSVKDEKREDGALLRALVESEKYIESDTALINRVLGREIGGKQNILVMNDEAHHAYRIIRDSENGDENEEEDDTEEFYREATVWIEGLDRVQKLRGINFCIDLSATPYFLGHVGQETNKPFPWVVSDFGLIDAIESGLVKIPQRAVRDTTGKEYPEYHNIWRFVLEKLTPAEKGGSKASPKSEAVLKWAHTPIAMLGGRWEKLREEVATKMTDPRPPVFIIVCKNTKIAKAVYDWLAEDKGPAGIPPANIEGFRNRNGQINTIRVDSKVVSETNSDTAKSDESRWMRFTLDTVGKLEWPKDRQGRALFPSGFEELAKKLERPLHPPGRDVRCIVSVGMLTEGWDCSTVTHIIGLRPFMSQLLCEQVVGRGLRRASYELGENERFKEEVAQVLGVPFEVIPFKANPTGDYAPPPKRWHVHAIPTKAEFEIRFPRVEGYTQAIRNRVTVNWDDVPMMYLEPGKIPPEVLMKALSMTNTGRPSLHGPGRLEERTLREWREKRRMQELVFECSKVLTRDYISKGKCTIPVHVLFPQLARIVARYVEEKVVALSPADKRDLFLAPYWGWLIERLVDAIQPDTESGETPEIPIYEKSRGPGSTEDVDFWTSRDVREVLHSHLNYVVADTARWEQTAAYYIDKHPAVHSFVKNAGLGFAIPYIFNGQPHDYMPDFIIRYKGEGSHYLIFETKGYDELAEVKEAAARRWIAAVNAEGSFGHWDYAVARKVSDVSGAVFAHAPTETVKPK
ncbi:MAG: DEAD/DEAH box helicase family protein [Acidobacteria bacterium]|nr:DEAD/DEAH box helicase family protein [Acidobacteriota bacterium]